MADLTDPIDGYTPTMPDGGVTPELRAAIAADVGEVKRIRADEADGRPVSRLDAAWASGVDLDGYVNEVSGIGDYLRDKTKGGSPTGPGFTLRHFSSIEAEALTRGSDLGARVVGVIPDEMTREGWDLQVQPTEDEAAQSIDPRAAMDAALREPRRAAAGWRKIARRRTRADDRIAAVALLRARRWDAVAAGLLAPVAAPPPPPGPLPHLNDEGVELAEAMDRTMEELDIIGAVNQALKYERAFGGGGILIGADDGVDDLTQPLDETRIRSIRHMTPYFGGWDGEIIAWRWYNDPRKPKFGQPEIYQLRNLGVPLARTPTPGELRPVASYVPSGPTGGMLFYVHESRFLLFPGDAATRRARVEMRGWGDSIFTRVEERLSQFDQAWGGLAILLQELSIATVKFDGLSEMLTSNDPKKKGSILERARMLSLTQSVARTRLLDKDEEFSRVTATLTGAPELMSQLLLVVAGACDMPVSLLVGQVKGGLGDAGNTDVRFFYDKVKSWIARRLMPKLRRAYKLAWLAKDSPTRGVEPERWSLVPRELWQLTRLETAQERKTYAEIDASNIGQGIYSAEEAAASRYGGPEFGTEITLDLEGRQAMAELDREREATPPAPGSGEDEPTAPVAPPNGVTTPTQPTTVPPLAATTSAIGRGDEVEANAARESRIATLEQRVDDLAAAEAEPLPAPAAPAPPPPPTPLEVLERGAVALHKYREAGVSLDTERVKQMVPELPVVDIVPADK